MADSAADIAREVLISADEVALPGSLRIPVSARGVVIFAHGSGSGRLSPRNQAVARYLNDWFCGTLLFDLLTPGEAEDRRNVFDIHRLASRMRDATRWLRQLHDTSPEIDCATLPIGYFGASTGAAAALVAAADLPHEIAAIVSRGGRPDLAGAALSTVTAPTLLIVGSLDVQVLHLNRQAQNQMHRCESRLEIINGATHLFEEPGTLEQVAHLAAEWFRQKF